MRGRGYGASCPRRRLAHQGEASAVTRGQAAQAPGRSARRRKASSESAAVGDERSLHGRTGGRPPRAPRWYLSADGSSYRSEVRARRSRRGRRGCGQASTASGRVAGRPRRPSLGGAVPRTDHCAPRRARRSRGRRTALPARAFVVGYCRSGGEGQQAGDRAVATRSRALRRNVPAKSISPSRRRVAMIVSASSKRPTRWSKG